jgi:hypothetical protein
MVKQMTFGPQHFNGMKNAIILLIWLISNSLLAQDSTERFHIPLKHWQLRLVSMDHLYPTYLADPLGVRFEVSSQRTLYADFDYEDELNNGGSSVGKLLVIPGVRFSLLQFTSKKNPLLGFEADLGFSVPSFMRAGNHDLIGVDGVYYFAVAARPTEWLALRFSKHHICTHVGDEYFTGNVKTPIDFNPWVTQLPVRDDFILSAAVKPLHFLKNERLNLLKIYGEIGYFDPGVDFLGTRQNKPNRQAIFNLQGGAELEYYFRNPYFGGCYTATNVSAYQSLAFAPNISWTAGYIFPQERNKRRLRVGANYYNGRSLSNQFYNRREKFIAFTVTMDV